MVAASDMVLMGTPLSCRDLTILRIRISQNRWYAAGMMPLIHEYDRGGDPDPDDGRVERLRLLMTSDTLYHGIDWSNGRHYNPVTMLVDEDVTERMTARQALGLVAECDRCMESMPDREGLARASSGYPLNLDRDTIRALSRGWTGGEGGPDADRLIARLHDQSGRLWIMLRNLMDADRMGYALDSDVERMLIGAIRWDADDPAIRIAGRTLRGMTWSPYRFDTIPAVVSWLLSGTHPMYASGTGVLAAMLRTLAFLDGKGFSTFGGPEGREGGGIPVVTLSDLQELVGACSGASGLPAGFLFESMMGSARMVDRDEAGRMVGGRVDWPGVCGDGGPAGQRHAIAKAGVFGSPMPFCGLMVVDDGRPQR